MAGTHLVHAVLGSDTIKDFKDPALEAGNLQGKISIWMPARVTHTRISSNST